MDEPNFDQADTVLFSEAPHTIIDNLYKAFNPEIRKDSKTLSFSVELGALEEGINTSINFSYDPLYDAYKPTIILTVQELSENPYLYLEFRHVLKAGFTDRFENADLIIKPIMDDYVVTIIYDQDTSITINVGPSGTGIRIYDLNGNELTKFEAYLPQFKISRQSEKKNKIEVVQILNTAQAISQRLKNYVSFLNSRKKNK